MADTPSTKSAAAAAKTTIHYACPCTDISHPPTIIAEKQSDNSQPETIQEEAEEAIPFNPHDPRANFALYPVEHLLFCTECHEFRCPRCSYEEALTAFCPSCLQERSRESVRTESNR